MRETAGDYPQELLNLYDDYAHSRVTRRDFLVKAQRYTVAGVTAAALLSRLSPNYALAEQVKPDDKRITTEWLDYASPKGHQKMRGYLAMPAVGPFDQRARLPGVIVVHENRGLNPYVQDVVRRVALAGFVAFGPDALTPLGGYPGSDDEGRDMQRKLDGDKIVEDFIAATLMLKDHRACNGRMGVVGFCFGGGMSNTLAVRLPDVIQAAAPYYGRQADVADVPKIKAAMQFHYAGLDQRINAGREPYEAALKAADVKFTAYEYEGKNHGFHNDTTPRYDKDAAALAWSRTIEFFNKTLKSEDA